MRYFPRWEPLTPTWTTWGTLTFTYTRNFPTNNANTLPPCASTPPLCISFSTSTSSSQRGNPPKLKSFILSYFPTYSSYAPLNIEREDPTHVHTHSISMKSYYLLACTSLLLSAPHIFLSNAPHLSHSTLPIIRTESRGRT